MHIARSRSSSFTALLVAAAGWAAAAPACAQECIWTRHANVPYFNTSSDRMVYHGGLQRVLFIRVWPASWPIQIISWDGAEWTLIDDTGPTGRIGGDVAYDSARDRLVFVGGSGASDTWEWDGQAWFQYNQAPPERYRHAMAYDESRQRTVVYGGITSGLTYQDTWEWDGQSWTQVATTGPSPAQRFINSFAYDSVRQRLVLYSYYGYPGSSISELWEWDGAVWVQRPVSFPFSPARFMVFDHGRGRLIFATSFDGTWELDSTTSTWSLREPAHGPTGPAAFDIARLRAVALAWEAGPAATMEYNGSATAVAPYIVKEYFDRFMVGSTATLRVDAVGTAIDFQWRREGQPLSNAGNISGVNTDTLVIDPVLESDRGLYDLLISNHCSSITSTPVQVGFCYPNCDESTMPPALNIDDFTCFINAFAHASTLPHQQQVEHYANCDRSYVAPTLNVDDFTCFINEFILGCR